MDLETLRKYYNTCNPDEPIQSEADERYVDLNVPYDNEYVRGTDWANSLARQIELSGPIPVCKYFSGLRGSGKTTELRCLAARLRREDRAHLLPIYIDAQRWIDLTATIDVTEILTVIVYETERQVLQAEGKDAEDAAKEGLLRRIYNKIIGTDAELKEAEIEALWGTKLVVELKTRSTLRDTIRKKVAVHPSRFIDEVRKALDELNVRACKLSFSGLFIIFDSLEKLQGISENWEEVLDSAERVFSRGAPYLRLPVHVLYTIPPALWWRLREEVHYLPMIKIRDRQGNRCEHGFVAAREIILKRIPFPALQEILGPEVKDRIDTLVRWSGGYPREIIRLVQVMLEIEPLPATEEAFERVFRRTADVYRRLALGSGAIEWLARVALDKSLTMESGAHREAADRMLSASIILRYLNDDEWFDVHPAIGGLEEPAIGGLEEFRRALIRLAGNKGKNGDNGERE